MPTSEKNLNILYDRALEFGKNWLRPVIEWVSELLPDLDVEKQLEISVYIETTRESINDYIYHHYDHYDRKLGRLDIKNEDALTWISTNYPWMSSKNIHRGFGQAMYYAWRG